MTGRDSDDSEMTPAWRPLRDDDRPHRLAGPGGPVPPARFVAIPQESAPPAGARPTKRPPSLPRVPKRGAVKPAVR
jgi:hypothetical protein